MEMYLTWTYTNWQYHSDIAYFPGGFLHTLHTIIDLRIVSTAMFQSTMDSMYDGGAIV